MQPRSQTRMKQENRRLENGDVVREKETMGQQEVKVGDEELVDRCFEGLGIPRHGQEGL